jgi:lysophospholipase L1-like esterase
VLVGGSLAFGTGLRSDDETFARQLEMLLDGAQVINAAVIGHRSGQELTYLLTELIDLDPDLVIALDGYNDFGNRYDARWVDFNGAMQIYRYLETSSTLLSDGAVRAVIRKLKEQRRDSQPNLELNEAVLEQSVSLYTTNVWKMHRICETFSSRFLCVLQPSRDWVITREDSLYVEFCGRAKETMSGHGIAFADINSHSESFLGDMFMDNLHLDAEGTSIMASIVAKEIIENDLLPDWPEDH